MPLPEILEGRPFPIAPGHYPPDDPRHNAEAYAAWQADHRALRAEIGDAAYGAWYDAAMPVALELVSGLSLHAYQVIR